MLRKMSFAGLAVATMAMMAGALLLRSDGGPTTATAAGGAELSLGTITFDGTKVRVPIMVGGTGFDAYNGVTSVLLWDPAVFTYSSYDTTGTIIPGVFCAAAPETSTTGAHNGVTTGENVGCTTLGAPLTATGLAVTIVLTPNTGCSGLHLLTLNPPDSDPNGSATQDALGANQVNTYGTIDAAVNAIGQACVVPPTATPTNTPAATNTPTNTPTVTPTPTITNTPT